MVTNKKMENKSSDRIGGSTSGEIWATPLVCASITMHCLFFDSKLKGVVTSRLPHVKQICLQNISNATDKMKELWKTVRLTSFQKPSLQSVSIVYEFAHSGLLLYRLWYRFLMSWAVILCFVQFGGSPNCLNFEKFRDTAPFSDFH